MVQRRGGSDRVEESFCEKRNENANANAQGTNQIMAGQSSMQSLGNIAISRKANVGRRSTYHGREFAIKPPKRQRPNNRNRGNSL